MSYDFERSLWVSTGEFGVKECKSLHELEAFLDEQDNSVACDRLGVAAGDTVTRMLAGSVPMELVVSEVTEDMIICGPWKFRRDNGAEVDEDLGWDGLKVTGSFLVKPGTVSSVR